MQYVSICNLSQKIVHQLQGPTQIHVFYWMPLFLLGRVTMAPLFTHKNSTSRKSALYSRQLVTILWNIHSTCPNKNCFQMVSRTTNLIHIYIYIYINDIYIYIYYTDIYIYIYSIYIYIHTQYIYIYTQYIYIYTYSICIYTYSYIYIYIYIINIYIYANLIYKVLLGIFPATFAYSTPALASLEGELRAGRGRGGHKGLLVRAFDAGLWGALLLMGWWVDGWDLEIFFICWQILLMGRFSSSIGKIWGRWCQSSFLVIAKVSSKMFQHIFRFLSPIGSMYGIYANIWGILMVNVTIYSIHGSYGSGIESRTMMGRWNIPCWESYWTGWSSGHCTPQPCPHVGLCRLAVSLGIFMLPRQHHKLQNCSTNSKPTRKPRSKICFQLKMEKKQQHMIKIKSKRHVTPHSCAVVRSAVLFPLLLLSPILPFVFLVSLLTLLAGRLLRLRLQHRRSQDELDFNGVQVYFEARPPAIPEPIGSMYANVYHQYTPNVSIYKPYMDSMGNDERYWKTIQSNWKQQIWATIHHTFSMSSHHLIFKKLITPKSPHWFSDSQQESSART